MNLHSAVLTSQRHPGPLYIRSCGYSNSAVDERDQLMHRRNRKCSTLAEPLTFLRRRPRGRIFLVLYEFRSPASKTIALIFELTE